MENGENALKHEQFIYNKTVLLMHLNDKTVAVIKSRDST